MEGHIERDEFANADPAPAAPRLGHRASSALIALALCLTLGLTWLGVANALRDHPADMADWQRDSWLVGGCISLLLLALAGLLWRLDRLTRRRETALTRERTSLAEKTAQLEATLAGMSDGIMMVDAEMRLLAWNDKFPELTGVPRDILRVG